jgi:tetratricopeptide (TPR) repeat protein
LIGKEYAESEPLQAEMLVAVGRQYMASERYEKATPVLERAAELAGRSGDPGLLSRALCPLALLRMIKGQQDDANELMERALVSLPDDSLHALQRAECLIDRGTFGFLTEQAEAMKRDGAAALAILDAIPVPPASKRIDALAVLAYGYYLARESREADAGYAELMNELKRTGRDETLLAADTCNNWALVHYQGNIAKAEPLCRRAIELRRSIEGGDAIAPSVSYNHAGVLLQLARYDEAKPLYEETIRTARERQEERIETDAMLELADLYIETGDLARATAQLATLGPLLAGPRPDPRRQVQMTYYQGRLAMAKGDAATAQDKFSSIVDIFEKRKSRISLFVFALNGLARSRIALGNAAGAAKAAGRAVEVAASFVEPDTPSYLIGLAKLAVGDAQLGVGDRDLAQASYREAIDQLEVTLGNDHPATAAARRGLATAAGP